MLAFSVLMKHEREDKIVANNLQCLDHIFKYPWTSTSTHKRQ